MSARIDGCPLDPTEPVCKGCPSAEECFEEVAPNPIPDIGFYDDEYDEDFYVSSMTQESGPLV